MRKLAEFVQRNCTSSISIANFRLQARVISSVYKGFDPVNNDQFSGVIRLSGSLLTLTLSSSAFISRWNTWWSTNPEPFPAVVVNCSVVGALYSTTTASSATILSLSFSPQGSPKTGQ